MSAGKYIHLYILHRLKKKILMTKNDEADSGMAMNIVSCFLLLFLLIYERMWTMLKNTLLILLITTWSTWTICLASLHACFVSPSAKWGKKYHVSIELLYFMYLTNAYYMPEITLSSRDVWVTRTGKFCPHGTYTLEMR